jgi:hypothetical protein
MTCNVLRLMTDRLSYLPCHLARSHHPPSIPAAICMISLPMRVYTPNTPPEGERARHPFSQIIYPLKGLHCHDAAVLHISPTHHQQKRPRTFRPSRSRATPRSDAPRAGRACSDLP